MGSPGAPPANSSRSCSDTSDALASCSVCSAFLGSSLIVFLLLETFSFVNSGAPLQHPNQLPSPSGRSTMRRVAAHAASAGVSHRTLSRTPPAAFVPFPVYALTRSVGFDVGSTAVDGGLAAGDLVQVLLQQLGRLCFLLDLFGFLSFFAHCVSPFRNGSFREFQGAPLM